MKKGCKVKLTVVSSGEDGVSMNTIDLSEIELDVLNNIIFKLERDGCDFSELESDIGIPQDTAQEALSNLGYKVASIMQYISG